MTQYGSSSYRGISEIKGETLYMFYILGPIENGALMDWLVEMELWNIENTLENINNVTSEKSIFLYAWTDNKKLAKQFQKERNMNRFILLKRDLSNTTEEELKDFLNICYDSQLYGEYLYTRGYEKPYPYPLVVTRFEISYVDMYLEEFDYVLDELPDVEIVETIIRCLKKKYQKLISKSAFSLIIKQVECYQQHNEPMNVTLDELYIIMSYFGETF